MSLHIETNLPEHSVVTYDEHTPVTAHPGLAAALYADRLRWASTILNVAAGHTDLGADLRHLGIEVDVTSLDPIYEREPGKNRVAGYAQAMPFEDERFSMTVSQFGLQHIPEAEVGEAIREMVRVTETTDSPTNLRKGIIIINPVFRAAKLQQALLKTGYDRDIVGIVEHDYGAVRQAERGILKSSLMIQKTEQLTPDRLDTIIDAVTQTHALRPMHRSLGELASRAFGGHSSM